MTKEREKSEIIHSPSFFAELFHRQISSHFTLFRIKYDLENTIEDEDGTIRKTIKPVALIEGESFLNSVNGLYLLKGFGEKDYFLELREDQYIGRDNTRNSFFLTINRVPPIVDYPNKKTWRAVVENDRIHPKKREMGRFPGIQITFSDINFEAQISWTGGDDELEDFFNSLTS